MIYKVVVESATAVFPLPYIMSPVKTLTVPPPSTVLGLIGAAVGRQVWLRDLPFLAYRFSYRTRGTDTEKVVTYDGSKGIRRGVRDVEFLFGCKLELYTTDWVARALERPFYSISLGRSQDLACTTRIERVSLVPARTGRLRGAVVPVRYALRWGCHGFVFNLALDFRRRPPRTPRTHPMMVVDEEVHLRDAFDDAGVLCAEAGSDELVFVLRYNNLTTTGTAG